MGCKRAKLHIFVSGMWPCAADDRLELGTPGFLCKRDETRETWLNESRQNIPLTKIILAKAICNSHIFIHIYI